MKTLPHSCDDYLSFYLTAILQSILFQTHMSQRHSFHANSLPNPISLHTSTKYNNRHLLSVSPSHHMPSTLHSGSGQYSDYILGMSPGAFFLLSIFLGFVLTVSIIIWICYRRHQTRQLYNQNPELFPHLPELSSKEETNLDKKEVKPLLGSPIIKKENQLQGPVYVLTAVEGETVGAYFDHRQKDQCYFEVEIVELNGVVEIGFLQADSLDAVKQKSETLGSVGVSLSSSGFVIALGENVYNYGFTLQFGDVIGIGLTKENDKFNERRAWITKNGILLNRPPSNELGKWLATVEIKDSEREEYNMGNSKPTNEKTDGKQVNQETLELQAAAERAAQQRAENLLQQQKIALKTYKNFDFYPTVLFPSQKTDTNPTTKGKAKPKAKTVIHFNVGGQVFRMQEAFFKSGLLK